MPSMPQPQSGSDLGDLGWREYVPDQGSTQSHRFGVDNSQVSLTIDADWTELRNLVPRILGYPYRESGTNKLRRVLPVRHPLFYWMRATAIGDASSIKFLEKTQENTTGGPIAKYSLVRLPIIYSTLPYDVVSDQEMDSGSQYFEGEWDRFVIKQSKPTVEFATLPGTAAKFISGSFAGADAAFTGSRGFLLSKTTLLWRWMHVPENFIFTTTGVATNIEAGLGKVNSATFAGRAPGTLLLDGVEFEPVIAPVAPQDMDLFEFQSPRMFNVALSMKFFDPPRSGGFTDTTFDKRGWNLAPNKDVVDATGLKWSPAVTNPGGSPFYSSYAFTDLFSAVPL